MENTFVRIATRKSPLALWQARKVAKLLTTRYPALNVELVRMSTQGDKVLDSPLAKVGGKGLFVKELERGLLEGEADIAVHSMKDVPTALPDGLHLPVILRREDPRDAFVSNHYDSITELPYRARIGTSSLRRQCQLKSTHPEIEVLSLRGNVNTRLAKLDAGDFDGIVLASAGLKRLGFKARVTNYLSTVQSLPAIGQGAIGIECRVDHEPIMKLIAPLDHEQTALCVRAERAFNAQLGGGCQVPIAGYAEAHANKLHLRGLIGYPDGHNVLRAEAHGQILEPEALGFKVADSLLSRGAEEIMNALGLENSSGE
jgi:hydroxymethylbilane synthase